MTRVRRCAAALLVTTLGLAVAGPGAVAGTSEFQKDEASGLEYLQIVTGGADPDAPLPVVVAIHGLGDNPNSFRLLLDDLPARARVVVPRAPTPHGEDGFSWFAFRADDGGEGARQLAGGITESAEKIAKLLESLARRYQGPSRSVACGFSQGGILSFALAAAHPELLASVVPVSGYLPPSLWPASRPKVRPLPKVAALHGDDDHLVSVQSARWTVEALRSNGYDATLRSWPEVGHAVVPAMRATLAAAVVEAVVELSPPGLALTGPPAPRRWKPTEPVDPKEEKDPAASSN